MSERFKFIKRNTPNNDEVLSMYTALALTKPRLQSVRGAGMLKTDRVEKIEIAVAQADGTSLTREYAPKGSAASLQPVVLPPSTFAAVEQRLPGAFTGYALGVDTLGAQSLSATTGFPVDVDDSDLVVLKFEDAGGALKDVNVEVRAYDASSNFPLTIGIDVKWDDVERATQFGQTALYILSAETTGVQGDVDKTRATAALFLAGRLDQAAKTMTLTRVLALFENSGYEMKRLAPGNYDRPVDVQDDIDRVKKAHAELAKWDYHNKFKSARDKWSKTEADHKQRVAEAARLNIANDKATKALTDAFDEYKAAYEDYKTKHEAFELTWITGAKAIGPDAQNPGPKTRLNPDENQAFLQAWDNLKKAETKVEEKYEDYALTALPNFTTAIQQAGLAVKKVVWDSSVNGPRTTEMVGTDTALTWYEKLVAGQAGQNAAFDEIFKMVEKLREGEAGEPSIYTPVTKTDDPVYPYVFLERPVGNTAAGNVSLIYAVYAAYAMPHPLAPNDPKYMTYLLKAFVYPKRAGSSALSEITKADHQIISSRGVGELANMGFKFMSLTKPGQYGDQVYALHAAEKKRNRKSFVNKLDTNALGSSSSLMNILFRRGELDKDSEKLFMEYMAVGDDSGAVSAGATTAGNVSVSKVKFKSRTAEKNLKEWITEAFVVAETDAGLFEGGRVPVGVQELVFFKKKGGTVLEPYSSGFYTSQNGVVRYVTPASGEVDGDDLPLATVQPSLLQANQLIAFAKTRLGVQGLVPYSYEPMIGEATIGGVQKTQVQVFDVKVHDVSDLRKNTVELEDIEEMDRLITLYGDTHAENGAPVYGFWADGETPSGVPAFNRVTEYTFSQTSGFWTAVTNSKFQGLVRVDNVEVDVKKGGFVHPADVEMLRIALPAAASDGNLYKQTLVGDLSGQYMRQASVLSVDAKVLRKKPITKVVRLKVAGNQLKQLENVALDKEDEYALVYLDKIPNEKKLEARPTLFAFSTFGVTNETDPLLATGRDMRLLDLASVRKTPSLADLKHKDIVNLVRALPLSGSYQDFVEKKPIVFRADVEFSLLERAADAIAINMFGKNLSSVGEFGGTAKAEALLKMTNVFEHPVAMQEAQGKPAKPKNVWPVYNKLYTFDAIFGRNKTFKLTEGGRNTVIRNAILYLAQAVLQNPWSITLGAETNPPAGKSPATAAGGSTGGTSGTAPRRSQRNRGGRGGNKGSKASAEEGVDAPSIIQQLENGIIPLELLH